MITPPVVRVVTDADTLIESEIFVSADEMCRLTEPKNVADGVFRAFDGEGREITLGLRERDEHGVWTAEIVVTSVGSEPSHRAELEALLRREILQWSQHGGPYAVDPDAIRSAPLEELIGCDKGMTSSTRVALGRAAARATTPPATPPATPASTAPSSPTPTTATAGSRRSPATACPRPA
jgi:hypothetical protein